MKTISVTLEDLRQLAREHRLYAVLDTCDATEVRSKVESLGSYRALCLYRGELSPELLSVAPYLVNVDDELLGWIEEIVWNEPWGIFIVAQSDIRNIRRHLRKFLVVQDTDGKGMYFRYYDPRVLPTFLTSCSEKETQSFFGSVQAFGFTERGQIARLMGRA